MVQCAFHQILGANGSLQNYYYNKKYNWIKEQNSKLRGYNFMKFSLQISSSLINPIIKLQSLIYKFKPQIYRSFREGLKKYKK